MNALDLKKIRTDLGLSQKGMAEKLGVHWRTVQNWEKTGNIALSEYTKICALRNQTAIEEPQTYYGGESENDLLPLIPVEAVAGFPTFEATGVTLAECEQYHVPEFKKSGAQFLIRVSGQSMYPSYMNGDILACRKIDEITFFQWGKVYVMDTNQGSLVKRVFEDKADENNIICHSEDSVHYPDYKLPKNDIRSLAIVIGMIRLE